MKRIAWRGLPGTSLAAALAGLAVVASSADAGSRVVGGEFTRPPNPTITPTDAAPGDTVTVSGVECPPADWTGEFVVNLWVKAGTNEESGAVMVDPPGGDVVDFYETPPDDALTVVPADDGSWSSPIRTRADPVATGQTFVAWCHTDDPADGAVLSRAALYFPGSPLHVEPASGPPGTRITVSGTYCPLPDWTGPFAATVYIHHLPEGGSGAVVFPGERAPGPVPPFDDPSVSVTVMPALDGSFQAELVVPERPSEFVGIVVGAQCATADAADGFVYYPWSSFELTAPSPTAPPQTTPPDFTG